ncbi:hypothetical protein Q8A67_001361 [Cirrhinus molitorella]|uniref:AIG1-type G domain-containing protein n=1 Tax=Cirrhinus molitorella TaxID=172907 RepID=A0AA88TXN8_9TELE|nr:hypothetical protein Q8A67_001361 [Cirrhinus molitorella]
MADPKISKDSSAEKGGPPVMEWQNSKDDIFLTQQKLNLKVDKPFQSEQNRYGESNLSDSYSSMDKIFPTLAIVSTGNSAAVHFGHENLLFGEKHPNIEIAETARIVAVKKKIAEVNASVINMIGLHEAELYLDSVSNVIGQLMNENEIHAFIFVVRLGQLTDADKMGLEWLQRVFGDKVLQFVMILFTYEREEECNTIKDDLKNNPVLEQLLEKCGGRYHTCNKMMNNQSEMKDLMKKIERLFNDNKQQCYTGKMFNTMLRETEDQQNCEFKSEDEPTVHKKRKEDATASKTGVKHRILVKTLILNLSPVRHSCHWNQIVTPTCNFFLALQQYFNTQRESCLERNPCPNRWSLAEEVCASVGDLRIVLLGKSLSENCRVGKVILGKAMFNSEAPPDQVQKERRMHKTVINVPHLLQPHLSDHQITEAVNECMHQSDPGPHVIILVLKLDQCLREDQEHVEKVLHSFSDNVYEHTMVLTTQEADCKLTKVNDVIKKIIKKCSNRHYQLQESSTSADLREQIENFAQKNSRRYLVCNEFASLEGSENSIEQQVTEEDHTESPLTVGLFGNSASIHTEPEKIPPGEEKPYKTVETPNTIFVQREIEECHTSAIKRTGLHETSSLGHCIDHAASPLTVALFGNSASVQYEPENILLGEEKPFKTVKTSRIVPTQRKIAERHVSVINMISLHETDSVHHLIDQLLGENKIHAFVFVVQLGKLTGAEDMGFEWLQRVFGDEVLQFVMILFTYEKEVECDTIMDDIENKIVLEQLLEKCGGRYQTCNKMMNNQSEMSELMDNIEHLFKQNQQQCYTADIYNTVPRQNIVQNNKDEIEISRIVSLQREIAERHISVINMIDLHEAELYLDSVYHLTDQVVIENEIHAFIFVVQLGQLTDADKMGLEWLQRVFGDDVLQFVMILFTYVREEECDTKVGDLKDNLVLQQLLDKCEGRYHTCNKMMNNQSEMRDLMNKIEHLFNENQQQHYTGEIRRKIFQDKKENGKKSVY